MTKLDYKAPMSPKYREELIEVLESLSVKYAQWFFYNFTKSKKRQYRLDGLLPEAWRRFLFRERNLKNKKILDHLIRMTNSTNLAQGQLGIDAQSRADERTIPYSDIAYKDREVFLNELFVIAGVESLLEFNGIFPLEEQGTFMSDGVVSEKWMAIILLLKGGKQFLDKCEDGDYDFPSSEEKQKTEETRQYSLMPGIVKLPNDKLIVDKRYSSGVLRRIEEYLDIERNGSVGPTARVRNHKIGLLMGINYGAVATMRKRDVKKRQPIQIRHLESIIVALELERTFFFEMIGLMDEEPYDETEAVLESVA